MFVEKFALKKKSYFADMQEVCKILILKEKNFPESEKKNLKKKLRKKKTFANNKITLLGSLVIRCKKKREMEFLVKHVVNKFFKTFFNRKFLLKKNEIFVTCYSTK